jgi:PPOX class probable F420-dependent enzyme
LGSAVKLGPEHVGFLSLPLLCKFASIGRDGYPHVTPTWFLYDGGKLVITTPETTVKLRNIRRDPRVTLLIDDGERYVMIKGKAAVAVGRDPASDIERLAVRYEGPDRARESVPELLKEKQVSIVVVPEQVVSQNL